ncbi:MAG: DtxR family iron (metal) dependent repressor [Methanobacteriota archaeon]|nr:MAG: DtxR family iron (metal) dependent repressor [Euryarchaeota archaeon]
MPSNEAEEVLEILWIKTEEEGLSAVRKEDLLSADYDLESALDELAEEGSVEVKGGNVRLTEKGKGEARDIIRRHRLAERLLVDVLEMAEERVEEAACRFEHALPRGVDESVCTLLGHPRLCPDGNPIPPGRCCEEGREKIERLISPLTELEVGCEGRIAYITSRRHERLQRLMAMGIVPGLPVRLLQTFPSYVIEVEETQIALDAEIADEIYVRCERH